MAHATDKIDDLPAGEGREADAVVEEVIRRRAAGEKLDDEQVLARHPNLGPKLGELLRRLGTVELAVEQAAAESAELRVPGYLVLDEIGRGGQGCVYRASRAGEAEARFAVKVVHGGPLARREHRERLAREAAVLAALDHPLIPKVYASGELNRGSSYLVTDLVHGRPFSPELLGRLPLHERVAMLAGVCRTLQAAHAKGVVHRDLKPGNVLLRDDGSAVLIDFGMADAGGDARTQLTVTGQFVGTHLWASPEQLAGVGDLTPASDVYALGVLLHQVATGGAFPPQVFAALRRLLEPPAAGGPAGDRSGTDKRGGGLVTDRVLGAVVRRCLDPDPRLRYPDAGALADELDRFLTGRPTLATAGLGRRWPGRRTLMALVGVAGVVGGGTAWFGAGRAWFAGGSAGGPAAPEAVINGRPPLPSRTGLMPHRMVWIPPGEFTMGSPDGEKYRLPDEAQRRVRIEQFST